MLGRLAAPPESRGCLDLAAIERLEAKDGLIDPDGPDSAERIAALRDFLRASAERADGRLAEQFWSGVDVVQLVHARAWFVEQLLLLAWKKLVPFREGVSLVAVQFEHFLECFDGSLVLLQVLVAQTQVVPNRCAIRSFT